LFDVCEVIYRAKEVGVEKIIVPGVDMSSSKQAIALAEKYDEVFAIVGAHPENVGGRDYSISNFRELAKSSKRVVGIGEIGLDFYWRTDNKDRQIEMFQKQIYLAIELDLPVVIHNRRAEKEIKKILEELPKAPRGQFHCWSGDGEFLSFVLEKGFYISFSGNITYKGAGDLRERLKQVPIERLLLETDSPYLAPEMIRGSRNEPKNVKMLAEFQAGLLDLSTEAFIKETSKNAQCLFSGT
jgi:TatD DNase family protein